jgi:hypothetical protein
LRHEQRCYSIAAIPPTSRNRSLHVHLSFAAGDPHHGGIFRNRQSDGEDLLGRRRAATPADGGYDAFVARCEAISLATGKAAGSSPTIVADTIYRAVMDRGWRLRFPVAPPAPLILRLRRILPEAWFLRLIRRHYGIDG